MFFRIRSPWAIIASAEGVVEAGDRLEGVLHHLLEVHDRVAGRVLLLLLEAGLRGGELLAELDNLRLGRAGTLANALEVRLEVGEAPLDRLDRLILELDDPVLLLELLA
jgi:hypothetical protein